MTNKERKKRSRQPHAVLGAGALTSHVYRRERDGEVAYRFNCFRMNDEATVSHALQPSDLRDLVKLCQVLSFTIADDGWLSRELRLQLFMLAEQLDEVTRTWEGDSP